MHCCSCGAQNQNSRPVHSNRLGPLAVVMEPWKKKPHPICFILPILPIFLEFACAGCYRLKKTTREHFNHFFNFLSTQETKEIVKLAYFLAVVVRRPTSVFSSPRQRIQGNRYSLRGLHRCRSWFGARARTVDGFGTLHVHTCTWNDNGCSSGRHLVLVSIKSSSMETVQGIIKTWNSQPQKAPHIDTKQVHSPMDWQRPTMCWSCPSRICPAKKSTLADVSGPARRVWRSACIIYSFGV